MILASLNETDNLYRFLVVLHVLTVIVGFGLSLLRLRQMPDEVPSDKRPMVMLAGRGGYHMARPRRTAVGRMALEELVSRYPSQPNAHYALGTYIDG